MAPTTFKSLKQLGQEMRHAIQGTGPELHDESRLTRVQRFLHFWAMTARGFAQNRCPVRASALAYTTLLALIPLLAVAASISTSLLKTQGQKPIEYLIEKLVQNVAPQLDLVPKGTDEAGGRQKVVQAITESIGKISSGTLGATGMIGLVFVAIMLLSTIEATFNDIWGVTHGRTWLSRVIQYWATVTLGPLIPVMAFTVNAGSQFKAVEAWVSGWPFIGQFLVNLVPFLVLSIAFALFYQLMPNTRVRWQAALVGGVVGGSLWQLNSLFNVLYVSKVVTYTNIYGPLSLVPVFLVGLYFSWMILLLGAQVAYSFQNRSAYLQQRLAANTNQTGREFAALRLMTRIGQQFNRGETPPTAIGLSQDLAIPSRLASDVLGLLVEARILTEVEGRETGYTPARPMEKISTDDIIQAMRHGGGKELETQEEPLRHLLLQQFRRIQDAEKSVARTVTLAGLVEEAELLPSPAPEVSPDRASA